MCEINARFFSLGVDLASWIHRALSHNQAKPSFIDIPDQNDQMIEVYFKMFDPTLPIHLIQSDKFLEAKGRSSIMEAFLDWIEKRTGLRPICVNPGQLRLVPDDSSETGYALYCVHPINESSNGAEEPLEKIHQVGLQVAVEECSVLSPEISRYIALNAVNDARSRLIAHDKRILGIIHQELDDLVTKHRVLTDEQASLLRSHIVPTFIPGSNESKQLLHSYHQGTISKDDFIIKPAREGRGQGIKFGDEVDTSEWEGILNDLQKPGLSSGRTTYVVQKLVKQAEDDLFLDEELGVQRSQRVGTYYSMDGEFLGLGAWRAIVAEERVCNMSLGRAWKMGSVIQKEDTDSHDT